MLATTLWHTRHTSNFRRPVNTEQFRKGARKHGGKVVTGLSGGALVFLFSIFATQREVERERQLCKESHAVLWRKMADLELAVDRKQTKLTHLIEPMTDGDDVSIPRLNTVGTATLLFDGTLIPDETQRNP